MCDCEFVEKEVVVPETLCGHYMKLKTYLPPLGNLPQICLM